MNVKEVNFWYWLVRQLPKKLVYFCFMHVTAHATTGEYETTVVPDITCMDAVKRYTDDHGIGV